MKYINNLLSRLEKEMREAEKYPVETLFPLNWKALKVGRCPKCGNRLRVPRKGLIAICSSKKHRNPFIVKLGTLKKLSTPRR